MANFFDLTANGTKKYSSAALENAANVSTVQSILMGLDGRNTDSSNAIFIMVFDSATAPTSASIPVITIGVPPAGSTTTNANGNYGYTVPQYGIQFTKGIQVAASSTDALTFTAISTNKTTFHVQYAIEDGATG